MSGRFCKSCAYLRRINGEKDHRYVCTFFEAFAMPWASVRPSNPGIGKRHVEPDLGPTMPPIPASIGDDWTEAMDCPQHQALP